MNNKNKLQWSLFFLRITIFLVFLVWTLDKFFNPIHSAKVYENFYLLSGLGASIMFAIGIIEIILISIFLLGWKKDLFYGIILVMHMISTLSSYKQYLNPFEGANLLFFAAWPMLAGCVILYILRNEDTKFTVN